MIKGITVKLYEKIQTGTDEFNAPVYQESPVDVENILVSPASTTEILDATNLYGKKAVYTLGIPKSDKHTWEDRKVEFFGQIWHTFGFVSAGIEANVPTAWNAKVSVEKVG